MVSEMSAVARNWWLFVVLGLVCLVTGILTIVWPGITLLTVGILAGIFLIVAAITEIVGAITGDASSRALSAILGVISLIAGLVCLRRPGESLLAIVVVLGIYLIATGVLHVILAFGDGGPRWWSVAHGVLDVIVGILILAWPGIGLVTLAVFFAVSMLVRGVVSIVLGFKLRSLRHEEPPAVHTATYAT
jgi:uncharacterized membrane protein HdeD (DUF308 family)